MASIETFQRVVWNYFQERARDLPWRLPEPTGSFDAYKILVSEIMLQQTQVPRVIPKYQQFLERFPTIKVLASAPLAEVLKVWSGLGYNRRAKYLQQAAKELVNLPQPWSYEQLINAPGIGPNTAKAVLAYAYDLPVVFIETNIRTVFLHHFFANDSAVHDKDILDKVQQALPKQHYRQWYWALMDYGAFLKRTAGAQLQRSRAYTKQSPFAGSRRQLRGQIMKLLSTDSLPVIRMHKLLPDERLPAVLAELQTEGLILKRAKYYELAS